MAIPKKEFVLATGDLANPAYYTEYDGKGAAQPNISEAMRFQDEDVAEKKASSIALKRNAPAFIPKSAPFLKKMKGAAPGHNSKH